MSVREPLRESDSERDQESDQEGRTGKVVKSYNKEVEQEMETGRCEATRGTSRANNKVGPVRADRQEDPEDVSLNERPHSEDASPKKRNELLDSEDAFTMLCNKLLDPK